MTASASAICGTRRGLTKLATSMRRAPMPISRSTSAILSVVVTRVDSFCKPSRGDTSTISTTLAMPVCIQTVFRAV